MLSALLHLWLVSSFCLAGPPPWSAGDLESLLSDLCADEEATRSSAVEALVADSDAALPERLVDHLATSEDHRLQKGILEVLRLKRDSGLEAVRARLSHIYSEEHSSILAAIQDAGGRAAWLVPALVEVLQSREEPLRSEALLVLGRIGESAWPAEKELRLLLEDADMRSAPEDDLVFRMRLGYCLYWITEDAAQSSPMLLLAITLRATDRVTREAVYGLGEMGEAARSSLVYLGMLRQRCPALEDVIDTAMAKIRGTEPLDGPRPWSEDHETTAKLVDRAGWALMWVNQDIKAYRKKHGVYPAQLAVLYPDAEKRAKRLVDPWGGEAIYKVDGGPFQLYSPGPNGIDDFEGGDDVLALEIIGIGGKKEGRRPCPTPRRSAGRKPPEDGDPRWQLQRVADQEAPPGPPWQHPLRPHTLDAFKV